MVHVKFMENIGFNNDHKIMALDIMNVKKYNFVSLIYDDCFFAFSE